MAAEPRATYRVQLHQGFTLTAAAELADYLAALGVSHLYCSPYLTAAPGSQHGYDVVDHRQVNPEVGGVVAHARLVQALKEHGLGQVLDIVPNHMAIHPANPWWWDVLENGPASRYAAYFDVDWDPPEARHSNQVLVPVLGDQYGRVLEAGEIQLALQDDRFVIRYFEHVFPVDPGTLGSLLAAAAEQADLPELAFLAGAFDRLPKATAGDRPGAGRRSRDLAVLYEMLTRLRRESPTAAAAIAAEVAAYNADPDRLDVLLELQNYRLAFWRIAARELGYRRFFDVTSLIGLHMDDEQVFADTHLQVLRWLQAGTLAGVRIDHPDGLRDPAGYLHRLRAVCPEAWIVVEKILEPGEALPDDWPVQGTTGYDFMRRVNGLLVDAEAEAALTALYGGLTGEPIDYPALARAMKRLVALEVLGSDLNRLTEMLLRLSEAHRRYRDYARFTLREALVELAACLPVYRTYVRATQPPQVSAADERTLAEAAAAAKAGRPDLDPLLFDWLRELLLLRLPGELEAEFALRFQQFTGPVMAKGVEDTTFYRYHRLTSLNEVGGDPGHFGTSLAEFHAANAATLAQWPGSLLATSTHDTKRSEDVRARINVLSEMPGAWAEAVRGWLAHNAPHRSAAGPDANTEYLFYQTLVGAWPIEADRAAAYLQKAGREAKQHTSWTTPNEAFESAVADFVRGCLADEAFVASVAAFVDSVREPGWINALAQTLLKLTAPGVADIYQGNELWDLSLVDPDNRRPVDYAVRRALLAELEAGLAPEAIWARADEGLPKLWVVRQALAVRKQHPEVFARGDYEPMLVPDAAGVAFIRAGRVMSLVPRLSARLRHRWASLAVALPAGNWHNPLTGEMLAGGPVGLAELWRRFPVALLVRQGAEAAA
jgi:(1->4)-alpha-D-glucan 1-alpha-D-glucosylmutase